MTSFSMISLHVDLNEAAKCVDHCVPLAIETIKISFKSQSAGSDFFEIKQC